MTQIRGNFHHLYLSLVWEGGPTPTSQHLKTWLTFFIGIYFAKMRSLVSAHLKGMEGISNQGFILNPISGLILSSSSCSQKKKKKKK